MSKGFERASEETLAWLRAIAVKGWASNIMSKHRHNYQEAAKLLLITTTKPYRLTNKAIELLQSEPQHSSPPIETRP